MFPRKPILRMRINRKLIDRFMGNSATRHGQECEPLAQQYYERVCRRKVKTTGLVIHERGPLASCQPDGVRDDDSILEIKCPAKKL